MISTVLLVIALICFICSTANISTPPINWLGLGAVFITLSMLVPSLGHG